LAVVYSVVANTNTVSVVIKSDLIYVVAKAVANGACFSVSVANFDVLVILAVVFIYAAVAITVVYRVIANTTTVSVVIKSDFIYVVAKAVANIAC
jgi:hypothetical protein